MWDPPHIYWFRNSGDGAQQSCFNQLSRAFWCRLKFENYRTRALLLKGQHGQHQLRALLKMQILGPHSKPTKSESLGVRPCFHKISKWFLFMSKWEALTHWLSALIVYLNHMGTSFKYSTPGSHTRPVKSGCLEVRPRRRVLLKVAKVEIPHFSRSKEIKVFGSK